MGNELVDAKNKIITRLEERIRALEQGLGAIKIRLEEGDPRVDWTPNILAIINNLLGK